jgi:hypothetical protein
VFRFETIPLIAGIVVALLGLAIIADAWLPEELGSRYERRRRERTERSLGGEAAIGFGVLCLAAAIVGRDSWDYSIVAVMAGTVLILGGAVLNFRYLKDRITNRGALRRGAGPAPAPPKRDRDRIR